MTTLLADDEVEMLEYVSVRAATMLSARGSTERLNVTDADTGFTERVILLFAGWGMSFDGTNYWKQLSDNTWKLFSTRTIDANDARALMACFINVAPL